MRTLCTSRIWTLAPHMSADSIDDLDPAYEPLVGIVLQHVEDPILQEIAAADRGQDFEAHLASLRGIVRGVLPIPMGWIPKEVLELTAYSDPVDDREHWMRLFACMTLLRAEQPPHHEHFHGDKTTILRLTKSAMAIGFDCSSAARRFLCWCLRRQPRADWLDPYLAIAIMILSVRLEDLSQSMVDHHISVVRSSQTEVWQLFDRHFCASSREWKVLIRETLSEPASLHEQIRNFGRYLFLESDIA